MTSGSFTFGNEAHWICRAHGNALYDLLRSPPLKEPRMPTPAMCQEMTRQAEQLARERAAAIKKRNRWWRRAGRWLGRKWDAFLVRVSWSLSGDYEDWED